MANEWYRGQPEKKARPNLRIFVEAQFTRGSRDPLSNVSEMNEIGIIYSFAASMCHAFYSYMMMERDFWSAQRATGVSHQVC